MSALSYAVSSVSRSVSGIHCRCLTKICSVNFFKKIGSEKTSWREWFIYLVSEASGSLWRRGGFKRHPRLRTAWKSAPNLEVAQGVVPQQVCYFLPSSKGHSGFPRWLSGNLPANTGDTRKVGGFEPWVGKMP